jgi:hypothetical protein
VDSRAVLNMGNKNIPIGFIGINQSYPVHFRVMAHSSGNCYSLTELNVYLILTHSLPNMLCGLLPTCSLNSHTFSESIKATRILFLD